MHPILFRNSYKSASFVSNPQLYEVNTEENTEDSNNVYNGASMLLFSGQNIKDVIKNCSFG